MGSTARHSGKARRATWRETQMDSEHHNLHNPHCPCILRHVSSEESNGTGQGWARSLPSTPGAPSPRRTQDRQRHQHHQSLIRGGSYRLRLGDVTPRCPKQQCVRSRFCPSVNPRLSIIDFYLLLQPRNLQDSTDVGTQSSLGLPHSRRLPGRTQAGDEGKKGDTSRRKRQVPAPFPPLQTHTANMSPACNSTAT